MAVSALTLAEQTSMRLIHAGFTHDSPELVVIREHNETIGRAQCDWPRCPEHGR